MGVTLAHHVFPAPAFMHRIPDRIARRDTELTQEQNRGRGEVFAVAAASAQQEAAQRSLIGARHFPQTLPGAVAELVFVLEKPAEGSQRLLPVLRLQLQLGNRLLDRKSTRLNSSHLGISY